MSRPAAIPCASAPPPPVQAAVSSVCCICMEHEEVHGTRLVQCRRCAICVHVKCYGLRLSSPDAATWLCQSCTYFSATSATAPTVSPQCAVCPIAGGALRRTNQRDVWCHVLCINWIPELFHSLKGGFDEAVDISLLDKSRSALRCLICGLRGGCIQCVSGRCAKAFHVLCAFRCPSSLLFTGYTADFQQIYHCKLHLSDVPSSLLTSKHELVDTSWLQLPAVQTYAKEHPVTSEGKCRFCSAKVTAINKDGHETQCLLGWLARQDALRRKQELHRLGLKPVEIVYKKKDTMLLASRSRASINDKQHRCASVLNVAL
uniref:PHD-type domain-containing protein n=1 Tax=Hyaloperonospora arabidopsidis (strain Emoy2) TaxID=559515 RepID=M4BV03_HYAAE